MIDWRMISYRALVTVGSAGCFAMFLNACDSKPDPDPIPDNIVNAVPAGGGANVQLRVYEFCYKGASYLYADRGISPRYIMSEGGGMIVMSCQPPNVKDIK